MLQACWVNTENAPIKTKRIGFFTRADASNVYLFEVIEETYPHPDAPEDAVVTLLNTRQVSQERIGSERAAAPYLHHHATLNCEVYMKTIGK